MAAMVHEGANWASKLGALDVLLGGKLPCCRQQYNENKHNPTTSGRKNSDSFWNKLCICLVYKVGRHLEVNSMGQYS